MIDIEPKAIPGCRANQAGYHQASQDAQDTLDVIDKLRQDEQEQATYTMGLN